MDRVALSDLLAHGDVVGGHQDGALVDIAPDGVGVTAVVDQGQTCVDSSSYPLQTKLVRQLVDLMRVVVACTNHLVDQSQHEGLKVAQTLILFHLQIG